MKKTMNNKGFSLIELIIVIAIMAVLVAVIAPNLMSYLGSSKKQTDNKNADEIESAIQTALTNLSSGQFDKTPITEFDPTGSGVKTGTVTSLVTGAKIVSGNTPADCFYANVRSQISKYIKPDGAGERVVTKQTNFDFQYVIWGDSNGGLHVKVACVKAGDPVPTAPAGS